MATPFIDTFDGAGATTDLSAWTPTGGTAWTRQDGVASGVTVRTSGGIHPGSTTPTSYVCDDQGSASQYLIFRSHTTASSVGNASYVAGRLVDASNLIGVRFTGTGSTGVSLTKIVGGTVTSLQTSQFTASEWLKLEIDGASGAAKARLYSGGTGSSPGTWTLVGSEQTISDSVFDGETSMGVRSSNTSAGTPFNVEFEAGALGGGGATAPGATITANAGVIAGSATGNASAAGSTITANASVIAGGASAGVAGTAPGATLTATASMTSGGASGIRNETALGTLITATVSFFAGGAEVFIPGTGGAWIPTIFRRRRR